MDRFMNKVKKLENGCWEWQGATNGLGYGSFSHEKKTIRAHRASWKIFKGEIPESNCVCHKCDNPKCVNPEHLFLGTNKFNTEDMMKKGRHYCQKLEKESHRFASKNPDYVPHPLELYFKENDIAIGKAAKKIGVSATHLHRILRRTHYPSLDLSYKIEKYTKGKVAWFEIIKPKD